VRAAERRGLHRLQCAGVVGERAQRAVAQRQRGVRRREAIQQPVRLAGVLAEVDRAGVRVDRAGLVGVTAECLDRLRVAVCILVVGIDLEDVTVALAAGEDRLGLLAGQPGLPWRAPARTVVVRAGEADVLADAVSVLVDLDVGRAAASLLVVDKARDRWHAVGLAATDLMIVDEHAAVAAMTHERGGAIGVIGRQRPTLQPRDARLRDDRVAKPAGSDKIGSATSGP